jgi:hypothetical protein
LRVVLDLKIAKLDAGRLPEGFRAVENALIERSVELAAKVINDCGLHLLSNGLKGDTKAEREAKNETTHREKSLLTGRPAPGRRLIRLKHGMALTQGEGRVPRQFRRWPRRVSVAHSSCRNEEVWPWQ